MSKSVISIYKIPLLISLTLAIVLLAVGSVRAPMDIAMVIAGVLVGTIVLDLEFFLNAYFLETKSDFSKTLVGFVKHSDWANALKHIYFNKEETKENSLNSSVFQMALALMSVFVVYSTPSLFAKALILTVFAQSIYVLFEYYFKGRTDDWFWAINTKPNRQGVHVYAFVLLVILSFCIYMF